MVCNICYITVLDNKICFPPMTENITKKFNNITFDSFQAIKEL